MNRTAVIDFREGKTFLFALSDRLGHFNARITGNNGIMRPKREVT
jgi:hypothetical protein